MKNPPHHFLSLSNRIEGLARQEEFSNQMAGRKSSRDNLSQRLEWRRFLDASEGLAAPIPQVLNSITESLEATQYHANESADGLQAAHLSQLVPSEPSNGLTRFQVETSQSMENCPQTAMPKEASGTWTAKVSLSSTPFSACARDVLSLNESLRSLESSSRLLQCPPLAGREWWEVLSRKLVPQLGSAPYIVVAVVGGTNIGKSVIFNHLAGSRVSATSPLASGTKHPVCLLPVGFAQTHNLSDVFPGFDVEEWSQSDSALENHDSHKLFWKESESVPANILVLDTPDVDSDAPVNWQRADGVRHCADVLVAVLTQQKYNDAAVKQFFRKAGAEDKAVVVVFNQVLLPEDEPYWPLWLQTFSKETGIEPEMVYVAPNDRRAAESNQLPFYLRTATVDSTKLNSVPETSVPDESTKSTPRDLRSELSELHFAAIKMRTLRGSMKLLVDPRHGIPAYLSEIQVRSADFRTASELLTTRQLAKIGNWPSIPNSLLIQEIRYWWRHQRHGWTKAIHDFYNTLGDGLVKSLKWATRSITGPEVDPIKQYQQSERTVILTAIENLFDGLYQLSELGNDLLRPRIANLISGERRSELLRAVQAAHEELNLERELQTVVANQMQTFQTDSPVLFDFLKNMDKLAAAARPVTSVALFFAGGGPLGEAIAPVAQDAAVQFVLHIAGGTGAVLAGETAISGTGSSLRAVEAHFRNLHAAFTSHRLEWLARLLKSNLLGSLQDELELAASIPKSAEFLKVREAVDTLSKQVG